MTLVSGFEFGRNFRRNTTQFVGDGAIGSSALSLHDDVMRRCLVRGKHIRR